MPTTTAMALMDATSVGIGKTSGPMLSEPVA